MRAGLFILAIILILVAIRSINVFNDVNTAIWAGGLAILCLWASFVIDKIRNFEE